MPLTGEVSEEVELPGTGEVPESLRNVSFLFTPDLTAWTTASICEMGTSYPPGYRPSRTLST